MTNKEYRQFLETLNIVLYPIIPYLKEDIKMKLEKGLAFIQKLIIDEEMKNE